ncbi:hypothetical protein CHS0354_012098 [Potamilus streckersoni]|uniref:C2H2-type domain-containing protein n=1 Tax=Potamilus streckersoni TaxID=2493646 RepID=A0AAE0S9U3_9BIVA|nr:hypothetical protein CHS0354_012098 [Potamilus streckersoni]
MVMDYSNYFQTEDDRSSGMQIGKGQGEHFQSKNQGNFRYDPFRNNRGRGGSQNFRCQSDSGGGRGKGNISFQVRGKDQNWRRGGNESRGIGGGRERGRAGERGREMQGLRGSGGGRGTIERGGGRGTIERGRGAGGERGRGAGERGTGRERGGEGRRGGRGQMGRGNYMLRQPDGGSSSEEDNSAYCEYCDLEFKTTQAYHVHTRGMLHTQRVLEGKKSVREKPQPDPESNEKYEPTERSEPVVTSKPTEQSRPIVKSEPTEKPESVQEPIIIDESDSDEDTDTTYCMYCNIDLKTAQAYYIHTRGMLHTQKVIDDKKMSEPQAKQETSGEAVYAKGKDINKNTEDNRKASEQKEQKPMKIPVKERDYTPNDVVMEQIAVPYHCKLCDVLCTGPITYKMHLDGSKHKTNVALAEKGEIIKDIPSSTEESQPSTFSECAKDCDDTPLIGLQYVTEFHTDDGQMTRFVCNLCECWCDGKTIIPHLTGLKHRQNYFEEEHPHIYNHITSFNLKKSKADLTESVTLFAKDVEEKEGRKEVKIRNYVAVEDKNVSSVQEETSKKDLAGKHKALETKKAEQEQNGSPPKKRCIDQTFDRDTKGGVREFERPKRGKFDGTGPRKLWQEGLERDKGSGRHAGFENKYRDTPDVSSKDWHNKRQGTHSQPHPSYSHYEDRCWEMEQPVADQEMARYHDIPPERKSRTSDSYDSRPGMEELENNRTRRLMQQFPRANERQRWEVEESHIQTRPNTLRQELFVGFNNSTEQYQNQLQRKQQQPPLFKQQQQQRGMVSNSLEHEGIADDMDSATHTGILSDIEHIMRTGNKNVADAIKRLASSMINSEDNADVALQISKMLTQALIQYRLKNLPANTSGKGNKVNPSQLPNLTQLMQHINTGQTQLPTSRPLVMPATGQGIRQEMTRQVWSHQQQTSTVLKTPLGSSSQQGTSSPRVSAHATTPKVSQRPQPSEQALKDLRKRAEAILNKCTSSSTARQVSMASMPMGYQQDFLNGQSQFSMATQMTNQPPLLTGMVFPPPYSSSE